MMFGATPYGEPAYAGTASLPESVEGTAELAIEAPTGSHPAEPVPLGSTVVLNITFKNPAGEPTSPSGVILTLERPNSKREVVSVVQEGVGKYSHSLEATESGRWRVRCSGSGVLVAAVEGVFWVANSEVV